MELLQIMLPYVVAAITWVAGYWMKGHQERRKNIATTDSDVAQATMQEAKTYAEFSEFMEAEFVKFRQIILKQSEKIATLELLVREMESKIELKERNLKNTQEEIKVLKEQNDLLRRSLKEFRDEQASKEDDERKID